MKRIEIVVVICAFILVLMTGFIIGRGYEFERGGIIVLNYRSIKDSSKYLGRKVYTINSPENLIILKCEKKKRVYYVPDRELWKWLNKHVFFCRMNNILYPVSADGSLMSDSFKLKEEE